MGRTGIPKQMECLGSLRSIRFLIHLAKMVLLGSDYIVLWPSDFQVVFARSLRMMLKETFLVEDPVTFCGGNQSFDCTNHSVWIHVIFLAYSNF
jgi:hypothetical protein